MPRRDRQGELIVALVVIVAMAFALAIGILLSLGGGETPAPIGESSPAAQVTAAETAALVLSPSVTSAPDEPSEVPPPDETETLPLVSPTATATGQEVALATEDISTEASTEAAETAAATQSLVQVISLTPTPSLTNSPGPTDTDSPTTPPTRRPSATPQPTDTATPTPRPSRTPRPSPTVTASATNSPSPSDTPTGTPRPSRTPRPSPSPTRTLFPTATTVSLAFVPTFTATPCSSRSDWARYTVQRGETLFRIALRYQLSLQELADANCIGNTALIFAGQTLYVPPYATPVASEALVDLSQNSVKGCAFPDVTISEPRPGAVLDGQLRILGAAGGEDFARYELAWQVDAPFQPFQVFLAAGQRVVGELGTLNTDAFPPGVYWLDLATYNTQGEVIGTCTIRVRFR